MAGGRWPVVSAQHRARRGFGHFIAIQARLACGPHGEGFGRPDRACIHVPLRLQHGHTPIALVVRDRPVERGGAAVADDAGGRITLEQARAAIFMVDSKGLITTTRGDALPQHKVAFARGDGTPDMTDLVEIVRHVRPHALVGLSGQGGAFTEPVLRELARHQERPLVFPLSNPTSCAEVTAGER